MLLEYTSLHLAHSFSIPMAIAAFGLSLGIANIDEQLPGPAYALLSGLNAATVGIVALAAYQLSTKAITDQLTRVLVFLGGTAGMLYNALWYFPVLMVGGGLAAITHDLRLWKYLYPSKLSKRPAGDEEHQDAIQMQGIPSSSSQDDARTSVKRRHADIPTPDVERVKSTPSGEAADERRATKLENWKVGLTIIAGFFATLIVIMVFRAYRRGYSRGYDLFANLYLAGTIIFGGGPVVIPLLREYVVAEGWVSPRDFLLGLALVQAFPGPNFNFAVYLGGLAVRSAVRPLPAIVGSLIGYVAIFAPGMILFTGTIGLWKALQRRQVVRSSLRGIHAAAVGLVFTAVYRLFEIGYIDEDFRSGTSLARDPWWVVIVATSFVGGLNFKLSPPLAIVLGAVMGLIWYGVART